MPEVSSLFVVRKLATSWRDIKATSRAASERILNECTPRLTLVFLTIVSKRALDA